MARSDLEDEVNAINAIYPDSVTELGSLLYELSIPGHEKLKIQLGFGDDYPDVRPKVLQIVSGDPKRYRDTKYIHLVAQETLERIFAPGEVCLFDYINELEQFAERYPEVEDEEEQEQEKEIDEELEQPQPQRDEKKVDNDLFNPIEGWTLSDPIVDKGSTFVGFSRAVHSVEEAQRYIDILTSERKIAKATHNITSWRIKQGAVQFQDFDDDGETAAGGRLLHLLTMMNAWNIVVVVSRWFGGTLLGPDRFKHINTAARDAVLRTGIEGLVEEKKAPRKRK